MEFVLLLSGSAVAWPTGTIATNPDGINPGTETAAKAIDVNTSTKWLDWGFGDTDIAVTGSSILIVDTGVANSVTFDSYKWMTGDDSPDRDPSTWTVSGSNDGSSWTLLDTRTDEQVTNSRSTYTSNYALTANTSPDVPTLLGPTSKVDGSTGTATQPSLTFTVSDPDISNLVSHQIQIDDSADFSSLIVDYTSVLTAQSSRTFTVGQAEGSGSYATGSATQTLADGAYYWRVRAIDDNTAASEYASANSGAIAFSTDTTSPTAPGTPTATTPEQDATPTWIWTASTDAISGLAAIPYAIEWSQDSAFATDVFSDTSTTASYTHSTALTTGTWYVRVRATDSLGNTSAYSSSGLTAIVSTSSPSPSPSPTPSSTPTPETSPTIEPTPSPSQNPTFFVTSSPTPFSTPSAVSPIAARRTATTRPHSVLSPISSSSATAIPTPTTLTPSSSPNGAQYSSPMLPESVANLSSYRLAIKVRNGENPVAGATVEIHSKVQRAVTDSEGYAYFESVEPGKHIAIVNYEGFGGEQSFTASGTNEQVNIIIDMKMINGFNTALVRSVIAILVLMVLGLLVALWRRRYVVKR
jgi:hypothetical protein